MLVCAFVTCVTVRLMKQETGLMCRPFRKVTLWVNPDLILSVCVPLHTQRNTHVPYDNDMKIKISGSLKINDLHYGGFEKDESPMWLCKVLTT